MISVLSTPALPYINIIPEGEELWNTPRSREVLDTVTESPVRSRVPTGALSRLREFDSTNNRLSNYLRPVGDAEIALRSAKNELTALRQLASDAVALSTSPTPPTAQPPANQPPPPVAATSTASIGPGTLVDGAAPGMRFSISSDNGSDFEFVVEGATTSWGDIATRLNEADIGVRISFKTTESGEPRLVIEPTDGKTGFRINGNSARQIVDDLVGISSPYDGGYAPAKFVDGAANPPAGSLIGPHGLTFARGGSFVAANSAPGIASGSSLRFVGSDGLPRTWTASSTTSVKRFLQDINAMRSSVVADLTPEGKLRLRDVQGGGVTISGVTGDFASTGGNLALRADVAPPPRPGLDGTPIAAQPSIHIERESVVSGAASGMRFAIRTDKGAYFNFTFDETAGTTTWGQISDALDAAGIGVKMRFDQNQVGSSRMTLYSVDGKTGFSIDGTSSWQVVDDLMGLNSPYDGGLEARKFSDGAKWPSANATNWPKGLTFGSGGAVQTSAPINAISVGSSITFIDGDGLRRTWTANGTSMPIQSMVNDILAMGSNIAAEIMADNRLRLRSTDGSEIRIVEATGDFDSATGISPFVPLTPPPPAPPVRTNAEKIASIGRVINFRLAEVRQTVASSTYSLPYTELPMHELTSQLMGSQAPAREDATTAELTAFQAKMSDGIAKAELSILQVSNRLGTLRTMEQKYKDLAVDLKTFATEMLDSYLEWDDAKEMASNIRTKLANTTATMSEAQARDLLILLG